MFRHWKSPRCCSELKGNQGPACLVRVIWYVQARGTVNGPRGLECLALLLAGIPFKRTPSSPCHSRSSPCLLPSELPRAPTSGDSLQRPDPPPQAPVLLLPMQETTWDHREYNPRSWPCSSIPQRLALAPALPRPPRHASSQGPPPTGPMPGAPCPPLCPSPLCAGGAPLFHSSHSLPPGISSAICALTAPQSLA